MTKNSGAGAYLAEAFGYCIHDPSLKGSTSLEVVDTILKNGGSFWMMIITPLK